MTTSNEIEDVHQVESFDRLVTPEFAPLADFAGFRAYEAVAVQETGRDLAPQTGQIAAEIVDYLRERPESSGLFAGEEAAVDEAKVK